MDNYENNPIRPDTSAEDPAQQTRRVSPFADSPYEMGGSAQPDGGSAWQPPYTPVDTPAPKPKKKSGAWKAVTAVISVVAIAAGSCAVTGAVLTGSFERENMQMRQAFEEELSALREQVAAAQRAADRTVGGISVSGTDSADGLTVGEVYSRNVRSVVLITSEAAGSGRLQGTTAVSTGSGFILTEDGYVVTNAHVVDGATSVTVTTHDGDVYDAKVLGADTVNDVAVLKVEAEGLQAVTIGSSGDLIVGDQVVAIGNPLGELTSTLTAGYISAKDRSVATDGSIINMLQTDAAINSGNSGGPLFNMRGEVVGITTAKYSGASSSGASIEGIGFAIPIDDVMPLVEDLRDYGYVTGAYLGVMVKDTDPQMAAYFEYYGLPAGPSVVEVTPGYCAEAAGVQAKDIIVALGEHEITCMSDLSRALRRFAAGDSTTVTVIRGGEKVVLPITLDEKPAAAQQPQLPAPEGEMPENGSFEEWYDYFAPFFGRGKNGD